MREAKEYYERLFSEMEKQGWELQKSAPGDRHGTWYQFFSHPIASAQHCLGLREAMIFMEGFLKGVGVL